MTAFAIIQDPDAMSSLNKRRKLDGESGLDEDEEITLRFDDDTSLKSSKGVLEAVSPVLKTALNDCEHDGSLRLPRTSAEAWTFILQCIESNDPAADISNEIEQMSDDAVVRIPPLHQVLNLCVLDRGLEAMSKV